MKSIKSAVAAFVALSLFATSAFAGVLYSEAFDTLAANVTLLQQPDTTIDFVDYSNFNVGSSNFSIPESPRMIAGSSDTRGVLIRANKDDDVADSVGANVIAGSNPIVFSGDYLVSFDMYLSVPVFTRPNGNLGIPTNGSTEQGLWGVGAKDSIPNTYENRFNPDGSMGWIVQENGFGTEDAGIFGTDPVTGYGELCDLGDTQFATDCWPSGDQSEPFNMAFDAPIVPGAPNNAAGNQWVEVDILVENGRVSVRYNGVEFFNEESTTTDGFAFLGYGDPFNSITGDADADDELLQEGMWGLFDNFRVVVPEPSSNLMCLLALALLPIARRR